MFDKIIDQYPTKTAFCEAMCISPQYFTQIERGRRPPPPKMVNALKEKHGLDPHALRPDIYPKSKN
jgi:hypothetical protein